MAPTYVATSHTFCTLRLLLPAPSHVSAHYPSTFLCKLESSYTVCLPSPQQPESEPPVLPPGSGTGWRAFVSEVGKCLSRQSSCVKKGWLHPVEKQF